MCQNEKLNGKIHYSDGTVVTAPLEKNESIWNAPKAKTNIPTLFTFNMPKGPKLPAAISLMRSSCDKPTNLLKLIYIKPAAKSDIGVCVKGVTFNGEISIRLIEWLETMKILSVDKVYLYSYSIHQNVSRLLKYYQKKGLVEVTKFTLPGGKPNKLGLQNQYLYENINYKRQIEVIPYNDCFYKNMNKHRYIINLDIDEVIVPKNGKTLKELTKM